MIHRLLQTRPRRVLIAALLYLLLAWTAIAVIDIYDVAGLRSTLGRDGEGPVWVHLFGEAGVTEMLQWLLLASVTLVAAVRSGQQLQMGNVPAARFLGLLGLAAVLMLIEDAGNPSHRLGDYGEDILGTGGFVVELVFRLPVFLVIGGVPLYAIVRYWGRIARGRDGSLLLLGGVGMYGLAAFSSVPANLLFDFYPRFGPWFTERILGGRLVSLEPFPGLGEALTPEDFTGWLFMDFVFEESVELIGAALLFAGVLALGSALAEPRQDPVEASTDA